MNKRSNAAAVISYITWLGFLIAILAGDRTDRFTMHHINQALVLNLAGLLGGLLAVIPVLGWMAAGIISVSVFVLECMGVYRAATWNDEPLPLVGEFHLIG